MRVFFLQFTFLFTKKKKNLQEDIQLIPTINVYTQIYIEFISFSLYPIYHFILMGFKLFSFFYTHLYPLRCHRVKCFFLVCEKYRTNYYKSVLHVYNIERHTDLTSDWRTPFNVLMENVCSNVNEQWKYRISHPRKCIFDVNGMSIYPEDKKCEFGYGINGKEMYSIIKYE